MIEIKKGVPPAILLEKQREAKARNLNPSDSYALLDHANKKVILQALMEEQGHLCAYCMRKIPDERELPPDTAPVTIEHWLPQKLANGDDKGQGLDYNNLFAVCSGNRGKRHTRKPRDLTCDAKRSQNHGQLILNPCDLSTLSKIKYKDNGEMTSDDSDILDDIQIKLNLNCVSDAVQLPETRKNVLDAFISSLPEDPTQILMFCQETLDLFEHETDPKTPYIGILLWWLKDYISASSHVENCATELT